ncbi:MAG: hypothetical protein IT373_06825 [Polyangiaceae bacterium]|nr:hypothetical protein [Polyangiaceae bacterium]
MRLAAGALLGAAIAVAIVGVASPGCVGALSLDGYRDAVDELCRCDEQLFFLSDCEGVLSARLGGVSATTRSAWLAFFAERCSDDCTSAYACYAQPGTCSTVGCTVAEDCCGFATGATCQLGECQGG